MVYDSAKLRAINLYFSSIVYEASKTLSKSSSETPRISKQTATPEEFENEALFLRLSLPCTLIRRNCPPKTELFETLLNTEEFENGSLCFGVDGKHFQNGAFGRRWRHDNHVIRLPEVSSNTNPKWRFCHVGQLKPCYVHAHGCTQAFLPPVILLPRAYDPSGLRQESRALGATSLK